MATEAVIHVVGYQKIAGRAADNRLRDRLNGNSGGGHGGNENAGGLRWLLTYADMITLMMALFVILFAMSTPNKVKIVTVAKDIAGGFDNQWAVNGPPPAGGKAADSKGNAQLHGASKKGQSRVLQIPEVQSDLEKYVTSHRLNGSVQLHLDARGLVISLLSDKSFYDSGSAELQPPTMAILDEVNKFLAQNSYLIRVEGNTDNAPIHTGDYPTNWELSTARATNVARYLVERDGMDPHRIGATGYGQFRPRFPNDTPAHMAANRRVDIVVLNAQLSQILGGSEKLP